MFCRNCGNEVQEQAAVCLKCGGYPQKGASFCQNCGAETAPAAVVCVKCGVGLAQSATGVSIPGAKSKLVAGLLGIFLGGLGIHRFYLGYTKIAVIQIVVSIVTCGAGTLWGFIEGILILAGNTITTDADGKPLTD